VGSTRVSCSSAMMLLAGLAACATPDRAVPYGAASVGMLLRDERVDPAAHSACLTGDSLFRQVPAIVLQWQPAIRFDSVWHSDTARWACQVVAAGHSKNSWVSVDTLIRTFTRRGWSDRTMMSADGPDGTVQSVHHAGVTCLVEGRWDGGDDSDTTYVPSDTIEVRLACTRTVATDTLVDSPGKMLTDAKVDLAPRSRVIGTRLKRPND
jgi:hypothetical protein